MKQFVIILIIFHFSSCSSHGNGNNYLPQKIKIYSMNNNTIHDINTNNFDIKDCFVNIGGQNKKVENLSYEELLNNKTYPQLLLDISKNEECYSNLVDILTNQIKKKGDTSALTIFHNMIKIRNLESFSDSYLKLFVENNELLIKHLAVNISDTLIQDEISKGVGYNCFSKEYVGSGESYPEYEGKILIMAKFDSTNKKYHIKSNLGEYDGFDIELFIKDKLDDIKYPLREKLILKSILGNLEFARFHNNLTSNNKSPKAGIISDPDGNTNLREGTSSSAKIILKIFNGAKVTILDILGNWYYVETADKSRIRGYLYKSNVKLQ